MVSGEKHPRVPLTSGFRERQNLYRAIPHEAMVWTWGAVAKPNLTVWWAQTWRHALSDWKIFVFCELYFHSNVDSWPLTATAVEYNYRWLRWSIFGSLGAAVAILWWFMWIALGRSAVEAAYLLFFYEWWCIGSDETGGSRWNRYSGKETHAETRYGSFSFNISVKFEFRDGT